jgi:hypothetical protein
MELAFQEWLLAASGYSGPGRDYDSGVTMSKPQIQVKNTLSETPSHTESQSVSKPLFKYPSFEHLFNSNGANGLAEVCSRLQQTKQNLERVVRQGSPADAERARRVIKSYETVIGFFTQIEPTG